MLSYILISLAFVSSSSSRSVSLFQLAFEDVLQKMPPSDIKGVTPADTYPLVIRPLNFAPAIVAPPDNLYPSHFFGTKNMVLGAIPLFKPLQSFDYIKYLPVSTSFYLNEPNVRNPFASLVGDDFPTKVSGPKPAFLPIQDTQIVRRPTKEKLFHEIQVADEVPAPIIGDSFPIKVTGPQPAFLPIQDTQVIRRPIKEKIVNNVQVVDEVPLFKVGDDFPIKVAGPQPAFLPIQDAQVIRRTTKEKINEIEVADQEPTFIMDNGFPIKVTGPQPAFSSIRDTQVFRKATNEKLSNTNEAVNKVSQEGPFIPLFSGHTRDSTDLRFTAPGGIAQSTQPLFGFNDFKNSKVSPNLLAISGIDVRTEGDGEGVPVIEV